jgi:hypothetical protein
MSRSRAQFYISLALICVGVIMLEPAACQRPLRIMTPDCGDAPLGTQCK